MSTRPRRIAIACQGGGSHTAFTAGALRRILEEDCEIVALSGTSGGAICALLAWFGLLKGDRAWAREALEGFWRDTSAAAPGDRFLNALLVGGARLRTWVSLYEVSPYALPEWGQRQLRALIERWVDFGSIEALLGPRSPRLLVGAVEVCSGQFRVFRDREISAEAILASTALPTLFRAVHVGEGVYWDGILSQNPPVRDLPDAHPDEIWVVQINPRTREREPWSVEEIHDRRDELAGNLSLEQELHFIEKFNQLVRSGVLAGERYRVIEVRRIELSRALDPASKLDRDPRLIASLLEQGYAEADRFLATREPA